MPWTAPTVATELIMSFLPVPSRWELSVALPRSTWANATALGAGLVKCNVTLGYKPILSLALQVGPGARAVIQQSVECPCAAAMNVANTLTTEEQSIFEMALIKRGYDLRLVIAVEIRRRRSAKCCRVVSPYGEGLIVPRVTRIRSGCYYASQLQIPLEGALLNRGLACGRNFPLIIFDAE